MGLAPGFFKYEAGSVCPTCHATLFNGRTPKYVELTLAGLARCPDTFFPPPDGVYLLEQSSPCAWHYQCPPYFCSWLLNPDHSILNVDAIVPWRWFWNLVEAPCIDAFKNEFDECGGEVQSVGGTATLRWGVGVGNGEDFLQWEIGEACCLCVNKIFSGFTPRFVEAHVSGTQRCPLVEKAPPRGLFLLEQISDCEWQLITPDYIFTWTLTETASSFIILANPEGTFMFHRTTPKMCWPHFLGQKIDDCNVLGVWGFEGEVTVKWGPWVVP